MHNDIKLIRAKEYGTDGRRRNVLMADTGLSSLQGRYRTQVVENGKVVRDNGWEPNLILDLGMDNIASNEICSLFEQCSSGTGTTEQKVDSGTTTVSKTGTTVTSSASFFAAGDVGKLIKWDTGEEHRITSFNSVTSVEVAASGTIASAEFTLWSVNITALTTFHANHSSYLTGAGNCETTRSSNTLTHRRTYDFAAEGANVTINELGVSKVTGGGTLFSRIKLSAGIALTIGQQLRVIYELDMTITPNSVTAKTPSATGWPIAPATTVDGDELWQNLQLSAVNTSGTTDDIGAVLPSDSGAGRSMEPFTNATTSLFGAWMFLSTDSTAHNTFPGSGPSRSANAATLQLTHDAYTNGSFERTKSATFAVGSANRTDWRSVGVGQRNTTGSQEPYQAGAQGIVFIFDEAQSKQNTAQLTFRFKWAWSQTLVN